MKKLGTATLFETMKEYQEYMASCGKIIKIKRKELLKEKGKKLYVYCPGCKTWYVRIGALEVNEKITCAFCKKKVRPNWFNVKGKTPCYNHLEERI